jgi:hypothetical protein
VRQIAHPVPSGCRRFQSAKTTDRPHDLQGWRHPRRDVGRAEIEPRRARRKEFTMSADGSTKIDLKPTAQSLGEAAASLRSYPACRS